MNILFLAFGFLKWFETPQSQQELYAPLMLTPVELERGGASRMEKVAECEDEVIANLCLREKLRGPEFRIELPEFPENGLESRGGGRPTSSESDRRSRRKRHSDAGTLSTR